MSIFSQNQMDKLLVIKLNGEPTSFVSYFNLHVWYWSNRRSWFIFALCRLLASVFLHLYSLMRCLYAACLQGVAVFEQKPQDFWGS